MTFGACAKHPNFPMINCPMCESEKPLDDGQEGKGLRWVKASERLPEKRKNYHVKVKYQDDKPECWNTGAVWNLTNWEHPSQYEPYTGMPAKLKVYEWLDESAALPVADGEGENGSGSVTPEIPLFHPTFKLLIMLNT